MRLRLSLKNTDGAGNVCRPRIDVTNAETDEKLKGVRRVSFDAPYDGVAVLKLEIIGFAVDLDGVPAEVTRLEPEVGPHGYADVTDMGAYWTKYERPPGKGPTPSS